MGRDFGGHVGSYGGGIGGVGEGIGARGLGIGKLGCGLAVAGECCLLHIQRQRSSRKTGDLPMTKELGLRLRSFEQARNIAALRSRGEPSVRVSAIGAVL